MNKENQLIVIHTVETLLELEKLTNRENVVKLINDGLFLERRNNSSGEEVFIPELLVNPTNHIIAICPFWIIEAFKKEYESLKV